MEPAIAHIAIVDDDPSVGRALGRLIRSLGMRSETFLSGEAFLQSVELGAEPDCVVLDVQMPGMTGIDVQRQLHDQDLSLPVIFITAQDDPGVAERAIAAGAAGFLRKPFADELLRRLICSALERGR